MSDLVVLSKRTQMTKAEEEENFRRFITGGRVMRTALLDAFEGKAHKVLKVASFEEYCKTRFGLSWDKSYLSNQVKAAQVERALSAPKPRVAIEPSEEDITEGGDEEQEVEGAEAVPVTLPYTRAMLYAKLPPEKWQAVHEELNVPSDDGKKPTASEVDAKLHKIVNRELKAMGKTKMAPVPKSVKRTMEPVKAAVYDGTPEQEEAEAAQSGTEGSGRSTEAILEAGSSFVNISKAEYMKMKEIIKNFVFAYDKLDETLIVSAYQSARAFLEGGA